MLQRLTSGMFGGRGQDDAGIREESRRGRKYEMGVFPKMWGTFVGPYSGLSYFAVYIGVPLFWETTKWPWENTLHDWL